jgi:FixJ family two-component response regulator
MAHGPLVCIVDDDAWVRRGLGDLVSSLGYTARVFECAEDFTRSGSIEETACIITDLNMPGISGLELQSLLRREGRDTPVIFVTAHTDEGRRATAFAQGATCFLLKPLDERHLIECLACAIDSESAFSLDGS